MSLPRSCPDCGHTDGHAAARGDAHPHHRRRSCAEQRRPAEQPRRRPERAESRIRGNCTHPRAVHVHGTRAAYVKDRCRCPACTAANTAAGNAAHRAQTLGRWHPFVDAAPVREHIGALRADFGVERIATLAGLATSHVRTPAGPGRDGQPPSAGYAQPRRSECSA